MTELSLVVPVYNERENLPLLMDAIYEALKSFKKWEVVFVDDGSVDGSVDVLDGFAKTDSKHVRVVVFRRNFGQTAAIAAGIDHSEGDIIVLLDADMQNDPADIPMLLEKLDEGYDLVSGWRKDRKDNRFTRTIPSNMANGLISWVTGVHLHDYGCTLKAYRRDALEGFPVVWRDAPLYSCVCTFCRGEDHRTSRPPPPTQIWRGKIRPGENRESRPGPVHCQIPAGLFPQAHASVWRDRHQFDRNEFPAPGVSVHSQGVLFY